MQTNEQNRNMEHNVKLFPFYKALSWDLLFYYSVSFLFLTQTKGIHASEVFFVDAFYPIFKFMFMIPINLLVQKLGQRKCLMIGNLFLAIEMLIFILATNIPLLILSNLFMAIGFNLKTIAETNILYSSIPKSEKRNEKFSKIDGRASSFYYYIDAITSIATGFLFIINGYLPMIICCLFCLLSTFLAYQFKELPYDIEEAKQFSAKKQLFQLRQAFQFIFKSNRLKYLILFGAVFNGVLAILVNLRSSLQTDIHLPNQYFGMVFALMQIVAGLASAKAIWFHKRYRNKTLTYFSITTTLSMILIGFLGLNSNSLGCSFSIIMMIFIIQNIIKGPFHTLIKTYLNSFASHTMRDNIISAYELSYGIARTLLTFAISALLGIINTSYTLIISGCLFTVFFLFLLDKMKHTVGLKPEEYSKKDIEFTEIH